MPLEYQSLESDVRAALVERVSEALSESSAALIPDDLMRGHLIEHLRAAVARTVAQALDEEPWLYFRIPVEVPGARHVLVHEVAPMIAALRDTHPVRAWWWLCKTDLLGPAIRLRVLAARHSSRQVADAVAVGLEALGHTFSTPCYEPEMLLFGGAQGMRAAHEWFCADSEFLSRWAATARPDRGPLVPEALSLALVMRMLHAAGLDLFERWDVFHAVAHKRAFGNREDKRFRRYEELAQRVVAAGPDHVLELYLANGNQALSDYVAVVDQLGRRLRSLYANGSLECGIREFFVPLILFHWNRLMLSPYAHFGLSHAVEQELWRVVRRDNDAVARA